MNADTLPILRQLVAFATISSETNLPLIEWVEQYLSAHNVAYWRVNEQPGKASLLARIGPDAAGGIVLSGHSDVVPVKGQPWDTDPFTLTEKDGNYFGRGTCDMKSFLAVSLAMVPEFIKATLKKPIWLAISHDEEIGCLGAAPMARALIEKNARPSLLVIGEPTDMQLVTGHKGILSYETIVTGHEAHSSMPEQGVNAVMILAELMTTLNRIAADVRVHGAQDAAFTTPYTTVHIGVVEGGTARNIIPRYARMAWEVRPLPGTDVEALLAPFHEQARALDGQIKRANAACGIVTNRLTSVRELRMDNTASYMPLAHRLAASNSAHAVAYGTEGGIFQGHDLPVIVCGPGSIDQAHQPNEFVSHAQLALCEAFMERVVEELRN
jgi:acetylornithine deacetylase